MVPEGWRERLESLVGHGRDLRSALLVVLAVMVAVLLLRFRTPPPRIAPPTTDPRVVASIEPSTTPPTPAPSTLLFVHVAGAVRKPGLYQLADTARVADAIDAAGGATRKADLGAINLAEALVDGAKIDVPKRGTSPAPTTGTTAATPAPSGASTPAPETIDINTADTVALETIPGIGPVLAGAIVSYRDDNGPFPSVDALLEVSGIGPATLESVRPYVRV